MQITRIFSDEFGNSQFGSAEFTLSAGDNILTEAPRLSQAHPAKRYLFVEHQPSWSRSFLPSPRRQCIICLQGSVTLTVSDGDSKSLSKGDAWIEEDVTGEGHKIAIGDDDVARFMVLQLE